MEGDLLLELYQSFWEVQPDRPDLAEQVFLAAAAAWDTTVMVTSSRKMFNLVKSPVWARVAAYSEWVHVSPPQSPLFIMEVKPQAEERTRREHLNPHPR